MSEQPSQLAQMKPYLIAAGALTIMLLVILFWPTTSEQPSAPVELPVSTQTDSVVAADTISDDNVESSDTFEPLPDTKEVVIGENQKDETTTAPPVIEEIPEPVTKPEIDVSDAVVKTMFAQVTDSPAFVRLLVNDALIQKFVINVSNLANAEASPKDALVVPPQQSFRVYTQADRQWIDPASFQRYTPYVDVLESLDTDELIKLFEQYKPVIEERYAEISRPGASFDDALIDALDTLLNTPQVPVPIEVYTDSVMYKFKDERIEALSAPQKQMLRMGPDNIRRLKEVLRDLKAELQ